MALVPAPVGHIFNLVQRGAEWDEVVALRNLGPNRELLCTTTTADAAAYGSTLIKLKIGAYRSPIAVLGAGAPYRAPPPGVPMASVNWMCDPSDSSTQLSTQDPVLDAMYMESEEVARVLSAPDNTDVTFECGANTLSLPDLGRLGSPLTIALGGVGFAHAPAVGVGAPPPIHGAVVGATASVGAHAGMGPGAPPSFSVDDMQKAIEEIRLQMAVNDAKGRRSRDKSKKKDKKKRGKSRRRRRGSSSDSSRSGKSKGSSSSSSETFFRWKEDTKDRRVAPKELARIQAEKFKTKSDLLTFAASHPGALTASFLGSVFQRVSQGRISRSKELRHVSVSQWAAQHSGLQEVRDKQEVLTMTAAMDYINSRDIASAMDVLSQRIQAIQSAKAKNGTWEKASNMELVVNPSESTAALPLRRLVV